MENFKGSARKLARKVVDDFCYELSHTVSEPVIDFTRVSSKEIISLIDHIEIIIRKAAGEKLDKTT